MKKIEAIIKRANYPTIVSELSRMGYPIIDRRNLEDSKVYDKQVGSKVGASGLKIVPLSKIELVVSEKDARRVVDLISSKSGLISNPAGKIFISEMEEVVDMDTREGSKDLEEDNIDFISKPLVKRSRLVPLQKFTLLKIHRIYEENQDRLRTDYRIKSFSDFVNHCIMSYLPTVERQLKHPTMVYGNNYREF